MPPAFSGYRPTANGLLLPPGAAGGTPVSQVTDLAKALSQAPRRQAFSQQRRALSGMLASKTAKFYSMFGTNGQSTTVRAQEKPRDSVPFSLLRSMYRRSPIDKMIIQARLHQMRYVSRRVLVPEQETGWRVVHKRHADPTFENTPDIERRCREMEDLIERVNRKVVPGGFRAFLNMTLKDELLYDRKVMICARDRLNRPQAYWTVDPTTIKPRIEVLAPWMIANNMNDPDIAAERMSYEIWRDARKDGTGSGIDLTNAAWIQELDGQIVAAWEEDEIDVDITNPRNEIDGYSYGTSIFEDSLEWTGAFISAFSYNVGWFNSKVPEQVVSLLGEVDEEGLDTFEKLILGQGSSADFHRLAFITGGNDLKVQAFPMRQSMREMAFPAWMRMLIAGKAACYRMDPRIINFDMATGNDQNLFKSSSREMQITLSQEEGFHTIAMTDEAWLTRVLIAPHYDDLMFRFVGLDRPNESDMAELLTARLAYSGIDEVRNQTGTLPPLEIPGLPGIGRIPLNPTFLQLMQLFLQMQQLQQQQANAAGAAQYYAGGGGGAQPTQPDEQTGATATAKSGDAPKSPGDVDRQSAGAPVKKSFTIVVDDDPF